MNLVSATARSLTTRPVMGAAVSITTKPSRPRTSLSPVIRSAPAGGGLSCPSADVTLDNTIVAQNTQHVGFLFALNDIAGSVSLSSADNLIGNGGSGGLSNGTNGNQVGVVNPDLGSLAYNGGPTETIALLPGSPAIGAGSVALAVDPSTGQPLTTDQRGSSFVRGSLTARSTSAHSKCSRPPSSPFR